MVAYDSILDAYDLQSNVTYTVDFKKRINSVTFLNNDLIAIGGDREEIEIHNLTESKLIMSFEAHENRVKEIVVLTQKQLTMLDANSVWLFTISSDSLLKMWDYDTNTPEVKPLAIASVNTTCRPTCLAVWVRPKKIKVRKVKKEKKVTALEGLKPTNVKTEVVVRSNDRSSKGSKILNSSKISPNKKRKNKVKNVKTNKRIKSEVK